MASTNRTKPNPKPLEEIPKKIYYSISEASEYTGVEAHVLRYWETKFSKLNPKRVGGNQRKYTRNDIDLLYEIVHLLYTEGYTLDGAEKKLKIGLQALRAEREALAGEQSELTYLNQEPNIESRTETEDPKKNLIKEIQQELEEILKII